jgi:hypothetical protein
MTATTFDPAKKGPGVTLSGGNLTVACSGNTAVLATDVLDEAEFVINSASEVMVGIHDGTGAFNALPGYAGTTSIALYGYNGHLYYNGAIIPGLPVSPYGAGDKIRVRLLPASNTVEFYKNDSPTPTVSYTNANVSGKVYFCVGCYTGGSNNITANFGAAPAPTPAPSPAPSPTPAPPNGWRADALIPGALVRVPSGTHNLTGTLEILAGQAWIFENCDLVLTGPGPMFRASAANWTMSGTWRCQGTSAATCLVLNNSRAFRVSGMRAIGFGCGLKIEDDPGQFVLPRGDRGQFENLVFRDCYAGIDSNYGGEYMLFSNTSAINCQRAIAISGGSMQFYGGNVVDCDIGIELRAGFNNAHGGFHGFNINHCITHAVYAEGVTNGHTFNGCHFYSDGASIGTIHLKNSAGVSFVGGEMDCAIVNEGTGVNSLMNVTATGALFAVTGTMAKQGCVKRDGTPA